MLAIIAQARQALIKYTPGATSYFSRKEVSNHSYQARSRTSNSSLFGRHYSHNSSRNSLPYGKLSLAFVLGVIAGGIYYQSKEVKSLKAVEALDSTELDARLFTYVPTTVSPSAQDYIKTTKPVGRDMTSLQDWQEARLGYESATIKDSQKAQELFIEKSFETNIRGVPVTIATPKGYEGNKVMIYIHGGGYTLGATKHLYQMFAPIAHEAKLKAYSIDYRLAPEHPYPAGLDDCIKVYEELLKNHAPENIVILGDSAGGALAVATMLKAHEKRLPMPRAMGLLSPWGDINRVGDTYYSLDGRSVNINYELSIRPSAEVYAPNRDHKLPLISPIYGSLSPLFPPTLITSGTKDLLLSCCVRLYENMETHGVKTKLSVREGMWHNYQEQLDLPESKKSTREVAQFFKNCLGHSNSDSQSKI